MTVELIGPRDVFGIEPQSERTQLVKGDAAKVYGIVSHEFGRWLWAATPRKSGTHELSVKVSANLADTRGIASTASLPDRTFKVKVEVNYVEASISAAKWVCGWTVAALIAGMIGAVTQDIWWPKLRAILGL